VASSDPISLELATSPQAAHGELLSAISNRMVQLHKRYYGKGPTRARSYLVGDLVVCLMRGGFTRAEETLIESGRADLVHEQRKEFQAALKHEFTGAISEITGRRVTAFMSNTHDDPPLIVELFVLEPETNGAGLDGAGLDGAGRDGAGPSR
jgi:uncharacterized protein YbcI